jgi:hypothetical protein
MKAHQGEEIVCDCARPAGSFRQTWTTVPAFRHRTIAISLPGAHRPQRFALNSPLTKSSSRERPWVSGSPTFDRLVTPIHTPGIISSELTIGNSLTIITNARWRNTVAALRRVQGKRA